MTELRQTLKALLKKHGTVPVLFEFARALPRDGGVGETLKVTILHKLTFWGQFAYRRGKVFDRVTGERC